MKLFFGIKQPLPKKDYNKTIVLDNIKYFNEEKERGFFIEEIIYNFYLKYENLNNKDLGFINVIETDTEVAIIYWNNKNKETIIFQKIDFDSYQLSIILNEELKEHEYRYFYLDLEKKILISKSSLKENEEIIEIIYPINLNSLTLFKSKKEIFLFFFHIFLGILILVISYFSIQKYLIPYLNNLSENKIEILKKDYEIKQKNLKKDKQELLEIQKIKEIDRINHDYIKFGKNLTKNLKNNKYIFFENGVYRNDKN